MSVVCLLLGAALGQNPSIQANGSNILLSAGAGGDVRLRVGTANPVSLTGLFAATDAVSMAVGAVSQAATGNAAEISGLRSSVVAQAGDLSRMVASASTAAAASSTTLAALQSTMQLATSRNVACLADLVSGVLPVNTEPAHGLCDVTTGGTCVVTCKTGYDAPGATNLALQKDTHGSSSAVSMPVQNVVDGDKNRGTRASRYVAQCVNAMCTVTINLGRTFTDIGQIRMYTGWPACQPGQTHLCDAAPFAGSAMCSHYFQVWRGAANPDLATIGNDMVSSDWVNIVEFPSATYFGEEHPTFSPPQHGQYVRLLVDNRIGPLCAAANRILRIYEIEVLQAATKSYRCGANGLEEVDSSEELECDMNDISID